MTLRGRVAHPSTYCSQMGHSKHSALFPIELDLLRLIESVDSAAEVPNLGDCSHSVPREGSLWHSVDRGRNSKIAPTMRIAWFGMLLVLPLKETVPELWATTPYLQRKHSDQGLPPEYTQVLLWPLELVLSQEQQRCISPAGIVSVKHE